MGLLGVDDLSSSGQRRQRRAVGKIFEVQCEELSQLPELHPDRVLVTA